MTSGVLQSDMQQSIRDLTGTALNIEGDFLALFDAEGVQAGTFNERLMAWANQRNGTNYVDIMGALNAYAVTLGFDAWNNVDFIPASGGGPPATALLWGSGTAMAWGGTGSELIWQ